MIQELKTVLFSNWTPRSFFTKKIVPAHFCSDFTRKPARAILDTLQTQYILHLFHFANTSLLQLGPRNSCKRLPAVQTLNSQNFQYKPNLILAMLKLRVRLFSTTSPLSKTGYSTVKPVHHLIEISKPALSPRYQPLLIPKDDIESIGFKPTEIGQDRLSEHYYNTLQSDLMLHFYEHEAQTIEGNKKREWEPTSPYALYRNLKKPRGTGRATRDVKPIGPKNVPELTGIVINLYNKAALDEGWLNISSRLQLSQLTNVKAKQLYNKSNVLQWKVREGKPCGSKVELTGRDMTQFFSTLTELVLPRIRTFEGIKNSSGDSNGNISFGLEPEDVKYFPEIENFQEAFPNIFGFNVTLQTSARTDEAARTLLSSLGMPFTN